MTGEPIGDKLNGVFKVVGPKVGIGLTTGDALIGQVMIKQPLRTWPIGVGLNVEWTNGTTLSGIWPSGIWLNVNTDGVSAVVDVIAVPVVAPVPVCVKAESSKEANWAAVGFEDESI